MGLNSLIIDEVHKAKRPEPVNKEIYTNAGASGENEFLFILKPEVFAKLTKQQSQELLALVLERFTTFDIQLDNVRVINAAYLDTYKVISKHYGVINAAARNFQKVITDEIRMNFQTIYDVSLSDVKIWGALELSRAYPEISDDVLAALWSKVDVKRLAGGVYAGKVYYKGQDLFIVNGFHPPQLKHFIAENRVVVTMNLSGNIHWREAREQFIGNTYPEKAIQGSLRKDLYNTFGKLGFDDVSYVINCVHLSAGPLEGLLELKRFNSEYQHNQERHLKDYGFGRMLLKEFNAEMVDVIMTNPLVQFGNKKTSLFDLTEEMDSKPALETIKQRLSSGKLTVGK